jgi:hypothetical protein
MVMKGMAWVRILVGAVWLNGALEKLLNPHFPRQFAQSLAIMLSQGGVAFGTGLGAPEFLNVDLMMALLSIIILLRPGAKTFSVDAVLAKRNPALSTLLTNRSKQLQ